jgi:hypothetical protein
MTLGRTPTGAIKIKTDGGLRAVECACCAPPEECCMYPAQALFDGFYTVDDLPDEIIYKNPFGEPLALYKGIKTSPITPAISGAFFGRPEPEFEDSFVYYAVDSYDEGWRKSAGLDFSPGLCLIGEEDGYQDQFAEAYTVSGPVSGTVTRESICTWTDENLRLTNFGYQWKVNGNNKSGLQNTPVGSYAGGYTVS